MVMSSKIWQPEGKNQVLQDDSDIYVNLNSYKQAINVNTYRINYQISKIVAFLGCNQVIWNY